MNNLFGYSIEYDLCKDIDITVLVEKCLLPIKEEEFFILVAASDTKQEISSLYDIFGKPVKLVYVKEEYIKLELNYLQTKIDIYSLALESLKHSPQIQEDSMVNHLIDKIITISIDLKSSDIHIESFESYMVMRFRIDGVLVQFFRFEVGLFNILSAVLKYMANLDISQKRYPLNGRFSKKIYNDTYDFRISTIPSIHNESLVLRILNNHTVKNDLGSLGLSDLLVKNIQTNLSKTQGLILVTGPTGSGKTTTLYSCLNYLNDNTKKIITIEDPVEYKIDGIVQININTELEFDYHTVLKNVLRQDPDVLMIGEIRDTLSLKIAIRAALTGHLVIATVHTNSAIETISRLQDLQAEPYLIATTLKMVIAQRLVRKLCVKCKRYNERTKYYEKVGCHHCNLTGYDGRMIIPEIFNVDSNVSKMIHEKENLQVIMNYCKENGFESLQKNGLDALQQGLTSMEEYVSTITNEI